MSSIKSHLFVLCLILLPLFFFIYRAYRVSTGDSASKFSVASNATWFIIYVKALRAIAVPFYSSPLRHLPQPTNDRFALGNGLDLIAPPPFTPILQIVERTSNQGLLLIRSFLLYSEAVVATSPAALSEILLARAYDFHKPPTSRAFLSRIVGNGLVVSEGQQHRLHRKLVTPAFHGGHINKLVPLFWRKAQEFVDTVSREMAIDESDKQAGGTIDISSIASRVTLDIIGVASLGKDFSTLKKPNNDLVEDYSMILDPSYNEVGLHAFVTMNFSPNIARYLFPKTDRMIRSTSGRLWSTCAQLVDEKRAAMLDDPDGHVDILSILLNSNCLTDEELIDQLLTCLAAGHETTASALTWAAYELARRPEIQQKLRAEIHSKSDIISGETINIGTLEAMPYLNAVCMETLRFWPTVPITSRMAVCDTSILGNPIPAGTSVLMMPCVINKLQALWGEDAEDFVPERWIRGDGNLHGGSESPYSMLTFIHGPRSCIGQAFAKNELKCLVAAMVNKFDIEMADPSAKVVPDGFITIKPRNGLNLRLRPL